jgi:hypothetical protein
LEVNVLQLRGSRQERARRSATRHSVDRKEGVAVLEGDDLYTGQHGAIKYLAGPGELL